MTHLPLDKTPNIGVHQTGSSSGPLGCSKLTSGGTPLPNPQKSAQIPQATLGYVEKVRPQLLSLRHGLLKTP